MRYLPLTNENRSEMLSKIGVDKVSDLYKNLPVFTGEFDLPPHQSEIHVERKMMKFAAQNRAAGESPFFLGAGIYNHHIPASVDYIIQRSEFLTAYTPYQPEIAQGTLQVIFEYQSMIAQLTEQDVANASMYDGATSCAEAMLMAMRLTGRRNVKLATALHPHYEDVLQSYMWNIDATFVDEYSEDIACVIVQSPDFFGTPHAYKKYREECDKIGAKLIVVIAEIVSLGLLPAPREADIVCGEAQSIGMPMSFGGPHLGFFACREEYLRQMPGRLCGQTVDVDGKPSFVLTLSTREQHIRRDKATSNICTNQGLCALAFTAHMALLGEDGFKNLAQINHERAQALETSLRVIDGIEIENEFYFNEFVIKVKDAKSLHKKLYEDDIIAGLLLDNHRILLTATELTTDDDIKILTDAVKGYVS
jgi:glycine dehydrogenase subunit 1